VALRTQQIIAHESGVTDTVDPLAGSYVIEHLTDEIETRVNEYLEKIDAMGGMIAAIESGYAAAEIAESAYRYQSTIDTGAAKIIGVNSFTTETEAPVEILRLDEQAAGQQAREVRKLKQNRDHPAVKQCLDRLKTAAAGTDNLMPLIIDAVAAYATIGEICDVLRGVFGTHRETIRI
jgi:methylmalonyl-CoA mutase N-terminal domain/subunit